MSAENGSSISPTEHKIIRQIEYYFGDFNLPRDKFLREEIKKDDGWVSLDTMTKFQRLASISTDHNIIIEAIRKCTNSLMVVNEDGTKIRRNPDNPVPESMKVVFDKYEDRTAFVKGFPTEDKLDDLQEFFDKAGITVNIVMRRRRHAKEFKGSVFVSFKEKDDCDKFLTSDEYKEYKGKELIRKLRTEYVKEKNEARQEAKAKVAEARADADGKRQEMQKARLRSRMTLGALLELTGLPKDVPESQIITGIKSMMRTAETPDVAFVETNKLKEGKVVVRFKEENSAAQALSKLQARENGLKFTPIARTSDNKNQTVRKADGKGDKKDQIKKEDIKKDDIKEEDVKGENEGEKVDEKMEVVNEKDKEVEKSDEKVVEPKMESDEDEVDADKDEDESGKSETFDLIAQVLVGQDEEVVWQHILDEKQQRASKRRGGPRRGQDGEPNWKRAKYASRD